MIASIKVLGAWRPLALALALGYSTLLYSYLRMSTA